MPEENTVPILPMQGAAGERMHVIQVVKAQCSYSGDGFSSNSVAAPVILMISAHFNGFK